jgi:hypothetical protein
MVLDQLERRVGDVRGVTFEAHAGSDYLDYGLTAGLRAHGATIERPTEGLPLGRQLAFYKQAFEQWLA